MKKKIVISVVLLSFGLSYAQQTSANAPSKSSAPLKSTSQRQTATPEQLPTKSADSPTSTPTVAPNETVITVPGICAPDTKPPDCVLKVSRADFERSINAINPNLPPEARRQNAVSYAQLLAMAQAAEQQKIQGDPVFQEKLRLQRMILLAQGLQRAFQQSSKPTQADLESYYTENSDKFEELALHRIMVPKGAKSADAKQIAQQIHDRAVAGEDPDKLEAEAYKDLKISGVPPTTDLGWKRRALIDPRHEPQVVQLHAGEVSSLIEDAQAFYIYKVDSKRLIPLESVEANLSRMLQGERAQEKMKQLLDGVKPQLNDAYFGPAPAPPPSLKRP